MHYKIASGIIVKTENAAKPASQSSKYLRSVLSELDHVDTAFDFGCGKLRYVDAILKGSDTLAIVDSEVQLSRVQTLGGIKTSIRDAIRRSNRIAAYNSEEFEKLNSRFDRGFCINVLPVVPILAKRRHILKVIRSKLRSTGNCLFVVQYRNSDFDRMRAMPNAREWRDGFLIDSVRGYSFYGLIKPDRLVLMLKKAGFAVRDVRLNEGSAYVWAGR